MKKVRIFFKYVFAFMFIFGGINHFLKPEFYLPMMPAYLPFHQLLIGVSGVFEILLGVALLIPQFSRWAAWGLVALLFAVFPANINMALHPEQFADMPQIVLWIRLPLQGVFIWWAFIYTKKAATNDVAA